MVRPIAEEALYYFNRSLEIYGADPTVTYNMSMCHYGLGQMEKALEFVNETLLLDPGSKYARAMRIRIEATRKSWISDKVTRLPDCMKEGEV